MKGGTSPGAVARTRHHRPGGSSAPSCLDQAIEKLKSLHDGEKGLIETVSCGEEAIPRLRELLLEREPSGLFQTRCLAVRALAALKAFDVLADFLRAQQEALDPAERMGDEAVMNAAARALAGQSTPQIFDLLMELAGTRPLPGVIAALGAMGRPEAIPFLIDALAEDESRPDAEAALREVGPRAHPLLAAAACRRGPESGPESESRLRQRRSALAVLSGSGIQRETWPVLRHLMDDRDPGIAVLACKICLQCAPRQEHPGARQRLASLLPRAGFVLRQ
ncbi:MAG TPA: HEAT repeat domain-containing protein, partial [Methylocella sp.]|nr:HEAT repeat domain-containing protein [Methylocella sp.]